MADLRFSVSSSYSGQIDTMWLKAHTVNDIAAQTVWHDPRSRVNKDTFYQAVKGQNIYWNVQCLDNPDLAR